jgi:subtilase family serine protease
MNNQDKQKLSAQVILKPAGGRNQSSAENVTSENVHLMMPSAEDFTKARSYFADLGFEVDAGFANSFSITGEKKLFEKTFETKISQNEKRAVKAHAEKGAESSELPLKKFSGEIKKIVETVTFTEPPDFGPGNF